MDSVEALPARWASRISQSGDCWVWTGGRNQKGYGITRFNGRHMAAHRAVYLHTGRSIPDGLQLDHLCRVRACVNPAHLEPVTNQENHWRSPHTFKLVCDKGHEIRGENVKIQGTQRLCRTCINANNREWRRRKRG